MNDMFMSRTHETYIYYDNEEEEEEKSMHLQEPLVLVLSECKNWVLMLLVKLLELHLLLHSTKTPEYYVFHDLPFITHSTVDPDEQNSTQFVRKCHVRKKNHGSVTCMCV